MYTKSSLESLKEKIDIVELIGGYVQLKPGGGVHKGLCPFHGEKTPSFTVNRASGHYHCFGCGAHGDSIAFLMNNQALSFIESVEVLAEKYNMHLELAEQKEQSGPSKAKLREANSAIGAFFHTMLMHSEEGSFARAYLADRGIDTEFITSFGVGYCPERSDLFHRAVQQLRIPKEILDELGILRGNHTLFSGRITFPIADQLGHIVGFSARKLSEKQPGPKYINTPETALFKKSHILYGLDKSRKRIAKEKKALIVEGQIDALRLIQEGFTFTVAGQGTAFTESHAKLLIDLGVENVYIGTDGDLAGREAAVKIGNMFQKEGVGVHVLSFEDGEDPDGVLKDEGPEGIELRLKGSSEYLSFLTAWYSRGIDMRSPSAKTTLIQRITKQIREWEHPLMVHESLRKLAELMHVPHELVGMRANESSRAYYIQKTASLASLTVDPDRVLETDLLRWLFFSGENQNEVVKLTYENVAAEHLKTAVCRRVFTLFLERFQQGEAVDLLSFGAALENPEDQLYLTEITQKRINTQKALEGCEETLRKILERHWFEERERIRIAIHSGVHSEEEVLSLAKEFDALKKKPPILVGQEK